MLPAQPNEEQRAIINVAPWNHLPGDIDARRQAIKRKNSSRRFGLGAAIVEVLVVVLTVAFGWGALPVPLIIWLLLQGYLQSITDVRPRLPIPTDQRALLHLFEEEADPRFHLVLVSFRVRRPGSKGPQSSPLSDFGVAFFDEGALVFSGQRSSFILTPQMLDQQELKVRENSSSIDPGRSVPVKTGDDLVVIHFDSLNDPRSVSFESRLQFVASLKQLLQAGKPSSHVGSIPSVDDLLDFLDPIEPKIYG